MNRLGWTLLALFFMAGVLIVAMIGDLPAGRVREGPAEVSLEPVIGPAGLAVPVAGVPANALVQTFDQERGGGTRSHNAIDIMAPTGTPVLAAMPGSVERLFTSDAGGLTIYVRSDDRQWIGYYAHLDSYAPGLAEGARVTRGQLIGRVGSTGNADPAAPHLHFALHRMAPGERWHGGRPVDPYPLLAAPVAPR